VFAQAKCLVLGTTAKQYHTFANAVCICTSSAGQLQVNYKNVMKQYGLGPNGGILTACNLFATRFDQVSRATSTQTQLHVYTPCILQQIPVCQML
jgi:hypothetical protein